MRLKLGVTIEWASADIARMLLIVLRRFPTPPGLSIQLFEQVHFAANLAPPKKVVGDIGNLLWILMGSLGIVLLIVCPTVANLLLVRVEGRCQELAIPGVISVSTDTAVPMDGTGNADPVELYCKSLVGMGSTGLTLPLGFRPTCPPAAPPVEALRAE